MKSKQALSTLVFGAVLLLSLNACSLKEPDMKKEQAESIHNMAEFTSKHADYARAENLYKKAYKLDPSKTNSLLALAKIEIIMGKQNEAIEVLHKLLRQDKNNKQAKSGLAVAYFSAGETMDAAEQWASLLKTEPKNTDALNGLGLVMEQIKNYKDAQICFQSALKSSPENSMLLNNLGLNLAIQGSVSQGIEELRKANKIKTSNRLKNNINLLQSINNKEQTQELLISKLQSVFPKQNTSLSAEDKQTLAKYVNEQCHSIG